MPCKKCLEKPNYHSFVKFGKIGDVNLFYTAPAKAQDLNEDGTKLANVLLHIEEGTEKKPWIWVVDCANMKIKHYTEMSFNTSLMRVLGNDPHLQAIWILRSNIWIRTTAALLKTIMKNNALNRVEYIDKTGLELFDSLRKKQLDETAIRWLLGQ